MGLIWQQEGNGEKAVEAYGKATQYDPKLATAWVNLASACIMTGDFKLALKAAKEAGCRFTLSTDAHDASHLRYMRYAVDQARRGRIRTSPDSDSPESFAGSPATT